MQFYFHVLHLMNVIEHHILVLMRQLMYNRNSFIVTVSAKTLNVSMQILTYFPGPAIFWYKAVKDM